MKVAASSSRLLLSLLYTVIVTVVGVLVQQYLSPSSSSSSSSHDKSILELVVRPEVGMESVGGMQSIKEELMRGIVWPLRKPDVFFRLPSLRPPSAFLLYGPPGTGKTMLAKAVAGEAGVPLLCLHAAAIENKWFGESPKLLASAFRVAREQLAPCVVFFDEIDSLGRARSEQDQACVYSLKCELLRHLDGAGTDLSRPVTVMACTNHLSSLDTALKRRFGRHLPLPLPDEESRRSILTVLLHDEANPPSSSCLTKLVKHTHGSSGSDLARLVHDANQLRLSSLDYESITTADEATAQLGRLHCRHFAIPR